MRFFINYFSGYRKPGGLKELLVLAIPMMVSTASDGIMIFTDRLFLARSGSDQMNAAMMGGTAIQVLQFFFFGLIGYSTALAAQYYGAQEKSNAAKVTMQSILISCFALPIIVMLSPLLKKLSLVLDVPVSQIGYQMQYMQILAWGSIFVLIRHSLSCFFSGIGKTKIVMYATITAMLVNIGLDYILIFGKLGFPAMGIKGAAIATVIGSICAIGILLIAYFQKELKREFAIAGSFVFDPTIMKKLLRFGYPAGLEMFLNFLAFTVMIGLFQSQGTAEATATTIMFNWDLVTFIPLLGIEIAVTSLVGRYMGAQRPQVAHRAAISGLKSGILFSFIVLLVFTFFPEPLVRLFKPDTNAELFEQTVPIAVNMIRLATLYVLAESMMVAFVGALRGAGDTLFTMIASVSLHWSFVPMLYISFRVLHLSVIFSWLLLIIFFLLFCAVLAWRFQSGKWKSLKVI